MILLLLLLTPLSQPVTPSDTTPTPANPLPSGQNFRQTFRLRAQDEATNIPDKDETIFQDNMNTYYSNIQFSSAFCNNPINNKHSKTLKINNLSPYIDKAIS